MKSSSQDSLSEQRHEPPQRPPNMMASASRISRLLFKWPYPLLKLGLERPLEDSDLPEILRQDTSRYNREYLQALWQRERERNPRNPSLHRAMLIDFFRSIWYVQPLLAAAATAKIVQAVVLGRLIETFETDDDRGYLWAGLLVACGVVILFEHHHVFFVTWRKGMQLRISCVAAIYDKSLKLSSTHQDTSQSTGKIMNLASNDVERFLLAALFISHLIWSPLQSIAILVVGWLQVGPSFAAGFGLLVFGFVPFQFYLSNRFAFFRSKIAAITDSRVNFVSQAVHGARVMKMSGYEWRFLDRIANWRAQEVDQIQRANRLKAWNEALFFSANVVISLVIFLVHVFIGGTLTAGKVFTVFTLINIMQLEMTKHVSLGVMGVSEVYVSITRIQKFLQFPERPSLQRKQASGENEKDDEIVISMSHVDCYWNHVQELSTFDDESDSRPNTTQVEDSNQDLKSHDDRETDSVTSSELIPALSDITLDLRRGQLTCIIGAVGCGKSALLQAIVGELPVYRGKLRYHDTDGHVDEEEKIAYASQDPWIMDGTVRENITLGRPFDEQWYNKVVDACGLRFDFEIFRNGDQTIVGDRGIQCSGGQRARIGLARAIYRDTDVLIADDPLSAVDAKVGRQIFREALMGLCVNHGKCVVLATHQHQYVHEQRCVLLVNGQIECVGSYSECVDAAGGKLSAHVANDAVDVLDSREEHTVQSPVDETKDKIIIDSDKNEVQDGNANLAQNANRDNVDDAAEDSREAKVSGVVEWSTYLNYIRAMGGLWVAFVLLLVFCATQGLVLWTVATMGRWAERPSEEQSSWDILGLVIGQGCLVIIFAVFRAMLSFRLTINASKKLHDTMAQAVLRAPISFFDTNPLGRILNRFSADVGSNDDLLPQTLFDFTVILFIVIGALSTTVASLPFALLAVPPLLYYFIMVRRVFVTSSRELKRLEGLARSPIYAMMSESLSGVATIRANSALQYFTLKFEAVHDSHTRAFFSFIASSRWVGFRMDSLVFMLMSLVSFLSVLFQTEGWFTIDPAILGLSISMLLQLAGMFQWCIRQSAEVVNQMVSVERVLSFGKIEPEAPLELENDETLDPSWPSHGAVEVRELSVRYRPSLPLALDRATFSVPNGSRVGVVGRTGSGKSTVVQTLFRLLEADKGSIEIDNVNIANIGLHRLRTSISVIPQVPTLFSGCTVRENLDLFNIHTDEAIHKALQDAHMSDVISELPKGIHSPVSEGGSNFSVGQRQLLCLARAILSKNKLLILDEATASVDRRTDQMLHESLHESFGDATIIAVAHRLDTVIEHDYILVLGQGKVLEFGSPADLLRSGGAFSKMVDDTGDISSKDLRQRAFNRTAKDKAT
ncbi:multidrug ABC transporter permease/ATPase [Nitzschia inconspicua]|uniref:Multidrug ABC transporter permease/ATPase n=1 Tax=Nitzschia inconspicua TaxID=303405 RepID=A0A9K3KXE6_9STRA|nr:multidrug ABC transporter permease/ATPase [Nitzschia inconspicua]